MVENATGACRHEMPPRWGQSRNERQCPVSVTRLRRKPTPNCGGFERREPVGIATSVRQSDQWPSGEHRRYGQKPGCVEAVPLSRGKAVDQGAMGDRRHGVKLHAQHIVAMLGKWFGRSWLTPGAEHLDSRRSIVHGDRQTGWMCGVSGLVTETELENETVALDLLKLGLC